MYIRKKFCYYCKKQVPIDELQYHKLFSGSMVEVCRSCRVKRNMKENSGKSSVESSDNKKAFQCMSCNFKFKFDPSLARTRFRCPYCGEIENIKYIKS